MGCSLSCVTGGQQRSQVVLHELEVRMEFVQRNAQSSGAAAEAGPDEMSG